jgi:hypothetical protein
MSVPRPGPSSASTSRFGLPSASQTETHHTPMACAPTPQRRPHRSDSFQHPRTEAGKHDDPQAPLFPLDESFPPPLLSETYLAKHLADLRRGGEIALSAKHVARHVKALRGVGQHLLRWRVVSSETSSLRWVVLIRRALTTQAFVRRCASFAQRPTSRRARHFQPYWTRRHPRTGRNHFRVWVVSPS